MQAGTSDTTSPWTTWAETERQLSAVVLLILEGVDELAATAQDRWPAADDGEVSPLHTLIASLVLLVEKLAALILELNRLIRG